MESILVLSNTSQVLNYQGTFPWGLENLKKSIQMVLQFFPMSSGDVVVLNDPSSGGLFPWALTSIHKVGEVFIARALSLQIPWAFADKVDSEALRIPPTPLVHNGILQEGIFESLISHPLAGPYLKETLLDLIQREKILPFKPLLPALKEPSKNPANLLLQKIRQELPTAEASSEIQLSTGEILKLKLATSDRGFSFDFSGTSVGTKCFMSETLVQGLCHQYLTQFLNLDHSTALELHNVTQFLTPKSSFLQARFPQGQWQGLARGSGAIWHSLQNVFQKIYSRQTFPRHNYFPLWIQIKNHGEKVDLAQWIVPCGSGAVEREAGLPSFALDGLQQRPTINDLQKYFEIDEFGLTPVATANKWNPGPGLQLSLRAHDKLTISWITENSPSLLKAQGKFSLMEPCAVIVRGELMSNIGEATVEAGDTVVFKTGSGAGII